MWSANFGVYCSNGGLINVENHDQRLYNNQIYKVESTEDTIHLDIPCLKLLLRNVEFDNDIYVVSSEGRSEYDRKLEEIIQYQTNEDASEFVNSFAKFDYAYARTSHKIQGQTLNNVYVMEGNIMKQKSTKLTDKFQSLYVAITRPIRIAHIYHKLS